MRRLLRHSVVRNAAALYGIQIAQYVIPWITFPYLTRILGPEKFGEIAFAQAIIQYFVVLTEYGFNFTATREVSIYRDDRERLSRLFTATMLAKTMLMICSLLVLLLLLVVVPRMRADAWLYLITFLTVISNVVFPQWLFQGIEKMGYVSAREIGARLIGLIPTFVFVHKPSDYLKAALIQSGSGLLAGIVGMWGFPKATTARLVRITKQDLAGTFRQGWEVFVSTAAINLYTRSNMVVLGYVGSNASLGYFSAAMKLVDAARGFVMPLSQAVFPHISRVSHASPIEGRDFIRRNAVRLSAPFAMVSAGMLIGSPIVIPILYGYKFDTSIRLLQWMSPIPFIVAIGTVFATHYMMGMGYKKEWSRLILSAGAFNFAAMVPLLLWLEPATAIAILSGLVEVWVAAGAYIFYLRKRVK